VVSAPAPTRAARPIPVRYVARTLSRPVGSRAPSTPSPKSSRVEPSSTSRASNTCASGGRPKSDGTCVHRTPFTSRTRLLSTPPAPPPGTYVSGGRFSVKRWNGTDASPPPSTSSRTVSPWLASATFPSSEAEPVSRASVPSTSSWSTRCAKPPWGVVIVGVAFTRATTGSVRASERITVRPTSKSAGRTIAPGVNAPCSIRRPSSIAAPSAVTRPGRWTVSPVTESP
jgi:hypothetical protein